MQIRIQSQFIAIQSNFIKLSFAQHFNINLCWLKCFHRIFYAQIITKLVLLSFDFGEEESRRNQSRFGTVMKVIEWNIKQQET